MLRQSICFAIGLLVAYTSGFGGRRPGELRPSLGGPIKNRQNIGAGSNDSFAAIDAAVVDIVAGVGPIPVVHFDQFGIPRVTPAPPPADPLPRKPSPANGAGNPQDRVPFIATLNQAVSPVWGIPYRVSQLAAQVINQSFVLADQQANSTGKGFTITSVSNGVRFDTWYAVTGANLPYPFDEIFLFPIGVTVSSNIQLASINPIWSISNNDTMGYSEAIDFIGIVHYLFDEDPSIRRIADLGSWTKFAFTQTAAHQMFFPIDQWQQNYYDAVDYMYRYIDHAGWSTIDKYARRCLLHGRLSDYYPRGFVRSNVPTLNVPNS